MTKLIPWREALHPRNPFGEFTHKVDSLAPAKRNGLPSHLSRADLLLPLDEQLGKLLQLKTAAEASGDQSLLASITNEELAVRVRQANPRLFKERPVAPWDIDKAAKKRDGDGDGFVDDRKNKRIAPVKRAAPVKRVAAKKPLSARGVKPKGGTSAAQRIMAGRNTQERKDNFLFEAMQLLGGKPAPKKPAPKAGDGMSARLGRMGAKAPAAKPGRPKSPFAAAGTPKTPTGAVRAAPGMELDMNDADLAEGLNTPARRNAGQAWANAMFQANKGDRAGFDAALADFFAHDEQWDDDVRDAVDDWLDGAKGDQWYDKGLDNIKKWKVKIESERKKWKATNAGAKPSSGPAAKNAIIDHFKNGGTIGDAPGGDLIGAMQSMPKRFQLLKLGSDGGVSSSYYVIDNETSTGLDVQVAAGGKALTTDKEVWFLKKSYFPDDILAEVMAANIYEQSELFPLRPRVKFATSLDANEKWMAMPHVGQVSDTMAVWDNASEFFGARGQGVFDGGAKYKGKSFKDLMQAGDDPGSFLRLALSDWFINNTRDRHLKNLLVTVSEEGKLAVSPIDHGLGFWNGGTPNRTLESFVKIGRPRGNFQNGVNYLNNDRKAIEKEIKAVAAKMKKVKKENLLDQLKTQDPPPSAAMIAQISEWYTDIQAKADWLSNPANLQDAVNMIMGA